MGTGLVLGDVAGRYQLLHVAVIDGHTTQPTVTQEVGTRVADVGEHECFRRLDGDHGGHFAGVVVDVEVWGSAASELIADHSNGGDRRAHACLAGICNRGTENVAVRVRDRADDRRGPWQFFRVEVGTHSIDRDLAGNLTGLVATHSVSDDVDAVDRQKVVFVLRAELAGMGR